VADPKGQQELAKIKSSFAFEEVASSVARNFNGKKLRGIEEVLLSIAGV